MGRPLNKKFFGNPEGPGSQLSVDAWFTGEGSAVIGWIVKQSGAGVYDITNGTLIERFRLQDGKPVAAGQASMIINPFGLSGETASASASLGGEGTIISITVNEGGSGYLTAPTVTITGPGEGATAFSTLESGVVPKDVISVTVSNGGTGYSEPGVVFTAPTGGDIEYVKNILAHGVKTWQGNTYNWDVILATTFRQGDLPLS